MAQKSRNSGGRGVLVSGLMILLLAGLIFGWAKVNHINSISGVYDYFHSWSNKTEECSGGQLAWNCGNSKNGSSSTQQTKAETQNSLNGLPVSNGVKVRVVYSDWDHWIGSPCNTRESLLKTLGKDVKSDSSTCRILAGEWQDGYSGDKLTDPQKINIDMVIPISYAASHGGQGWSKEQKTAFANDTNQLLVVSTENSQKRAGQSPAKWSPEDKYVCGYAKTWVSTAQKYQISIAQSDKDALDKDLQKCTE